MRKSTLWALGIAVVVAAAACGKKGEDSGQGQGAPSGGPAPTTARSVTAKAIEDAFAASENCQKLATCCAEGVVAVLDVMQKPCEQVKGLGDGEQGAKNLSSPDFVTRTCDNMVQGLSDSLSMLLPKDQAPAACGWAYQ